MEAAIEKHIDPSNLLIERAVAEWTGGDETCFLGDEANSSFNMTVGLDPSTDKLLLWFQLVVSVKRHRAATHSRPRSLFMLLQADMFDHDHDPCLSLNPVSELPAPKGTLEAISRAGLGGDNTRTFQLHLRLKERSQVVMPKSDPPLIPATEKSRRLLRSFRSLSEATTLSVYVPLGTDRVQSLQDVCSRLLSKQLLSHDIDFESFYTGGAERNVWSNFDIFIDSASAHHAPKAAALTSKPTASPQPQAPSFERKGTKAVEAAAEEEERAPTEPVPPPQYTEHNASSAKQPISSPAPAPASTAAARPELNLDGETTEEDEEPPIEQAPASPHSPPRKKRKAADNDSPAEPAASSPAPPPPHAAALPPPEEGEAEAAPLPPYPSSTTTSTSSSRPRSNNKPRVRFTSTDPTSSTQQRTISSHLNTTPSSLRTALARFLRWLAAVDVDLQDKYDGLLWDMGDAAAGGDGVKFYRLQARCKAEVLVGYRRREPGEVVGGGTGGGGSTACSGGGRRGGGGVVEE